MPRKHFEDTGFQYDQSLAEEAPELEKAGFFEEMEGTFSCLFQTKKEVKDALEGLGIPYAKFNKFLEGCGASKNSKKRLKPK